MKHNEIFAALDQKYIFWYEKFELGFDTENNEKKLIAHASNARVPLYQT